MNRLPAFWIAIIGIVAAVAVVAVLITPAPDESPSTGPHAPAKIFLARAAGVFLSLTHLSPQHSLEVRAFVPWAGVDLLSYTCARLR